MAGGRKSQPAADDMDRAANGRDQGDPMSEHLMLEMIRQVGDRLARHEEGCVEERREAKRDRHDFRSEVALTLNGLREEMRAGFAKIDGSVSKIHERINAITEKGYERETTAWGWRMKTAAAVIGILLGVAGFALAQWLLARGVAQ